MNAYAVVIGGVVAFIIGGELKPSLIFYFLFAFLIVFTFVGFFLTTRWIYAFECHRIRVNRLANILWLESGSKARLDPTMDIPAISVLPESICKIRIPGALRGIINELFRTRYWFALFYLFILIGLVIFSSIGYVRQNFSVWLLVLASVALVFGFCLFCRWWFLLARIDKPKKVILEGCNGEWAQERYLPFLIEKAIIGDITLWAIDIQPEIKLNSPGNHSLWQIAEDKGRAHYLNADKDRESLGIPRDIDYVFIVTPDRCHCKGAEFWLSRLSTKGKIFIEKPLDASIRTAEQLKEKIMDKNIVYGFDHYLATLHPFLRSYLKKVGGPESLEIKILEDTEIPSEKADTFREGMIFDLFPHVLAVSAAVVEKKLAPTEAILQTVKFKEGARAKYKDWPFPSETCARIEFLVGNKRVTVTGVVGKGIGETPDKQMVIYGTHGRNIKIDFQNDSFSVNDKPEGNLESKHVESFLETVLEGSSIDSAPGVLSFAAAFEILKWLLAIRGNTIMEPEDYDIGTFPL
jgi:predicted dehydrogenase